MGELDKLFDNMRDLKLNENFRFRLIRRPTKNDCILRVVFHWEENNNNDLKVFWKQKLYRYPLDFEFKHGYKKKLNAQLIEHLNTTGEAPDLF